MLLKVKTTGENWDVRRDKLMLLPRTDVCMGGAGGVCVKLCAQKYYTSFSI